MVFDLGSKKKILGGALLMNHPVFSGGDPFCAFEYLKKVISEIKPGPKGDFINGESGSSEKPFGHFQTGLCQAIDKAHSQLVFEHAANVALGISEMIRKAAQF